jgi:hypothetical protein
MEENIKNLVDKAGKADKSEDAMRFSQAAVNAANAMAQLQNTKRNLA